MGELIVAAIKLDAAHGADVVGSFDFQTAAAAKLRVKLGDHSAVAISPDAVAIAGFYDFLRPGPDGQPVVVPARFSFVIVKKDGLWRVAHHHSSLRPKHP